MGRRTRVLLLAEVRNAMVAIVGGKESGVIICIVEGSMIGCVGEGGGLMVVGVAGISLFEPARSGGSVLPSLL